MFLSHLSLRIALLLAINCCNQGLTDESLNADFKILFIGNSLTRSNDLPALVREIGGLDDVALVTTEVLFNDYSLEDHWNTGVAQKHIQNQKFDFVVCQQGPSALQESRELLIEYSKRFSRESKPNDAKFALYMVWPSLSRSFDLDNVIYSYTEAAKVANAVLCPAGLAWKKAWEEDKSLGLYSRDDFHPNVKGSVLAALTIYASLFNKTNLDFIELDKTSWRKEMTEKEFDLLKRSALASRKQ